jgi:hypothetical protein
VHGFDGLIARVDYWRAIVERPEADSGKGYAVEFKYLLTDTANQFG